MIITSKILSAQKSIIHGISTRFPGEAPSFNNLSRHVGDEINNITKNRDRFFGSLGIDQSRLVHANQVHSDNIQIVKEPGLYPGTDAFITREKDLFLVISIADCMPVMIFDPVSKALANIHSGWRGTQKDIAGKTISLMSENCGSKPGNLIVFMGPAISQRNFEVDEDVANLFPRKYVIAKPRKPGKFLVDTGIMVYEGLLNSGIKKENIERSEICTFNENNMHSYRRDKDRSGRMFAVIGIREE